jgi:hypothetical protein
MQAAAAPRVHPDDLDRARIALTTLAAFAAIAAAQLADLTTFLRMISVGGLAAEANPIVVHLGSSVGLEILVLLKLALIPFVVLIVTVLARVRTRLAASVLTFATLTGLVGALSNILAFA